MELKVFSVIFCVNVDYVWPLSVKYGSVEQLPVVLLATHEGGGSDWFRKLVEVSTGFFVGIEDKQKQEIITFSLTYIHFTQKIFGNVQSWKFAYIRLLN